ncbi:MAG: hypothetical protein KJO70_08845 [Gammaproteobacteria bacterium]|nr:hypothetical protein [Gammaproteobacteria bacterium]MBT8051292.1 hypothetical protein [Gammaproteobacteria bacterium]NNJ79816.1 hypothetical protein [Xanthomonadales bacterium]
MQTVYFIAPLGAIVLLVLFAVRRIEAASYIRRSVDGSHPSRVAAGARTGQSEQWDPLEERYVDWYTSEKAERNREIIVHGQGSESLNDDQFNPVGVAYRPTYSYRANTRP